MSITLPPNVVTLQNDTYSSLLNKLRDRTLSSPEVRSLVKTLTSLIVSSIDIKAQQGEVIAVIVVLRSGLSMFESFMSEIPAESAASASTYHIGIFRDKATLQPVEYYNKLPAKPDAIKRAFVLDPLIATGGTAGAVVNIMKDWGVETVNFISLLSSTAGITRVAKEWPDHTTFFVGSLDPGLDSQSFISPGVGDIGDRLFGTSGRFFKSYLLVYRSFLFVHCPSESLFFSDHHRAVTVLIRVKNGQKVFPGTFMSPRKESLLLVRTNMPDGATMGILTPI